MEKKFVSQCTWTGYMGAGGWPVCLVYKADIEKVRSNQDNSFL